MCPIIRTSWKIISLSFKNNGRGVFIFKYADDTILFFEHDPEKAVNMKLILSLFEQLSGLKINFHKSEIFCFGKAKDFQEDYRHI